MNAAAKWFVSQSGAHGFEGGIDFVQLPINPWLAALRIGTATPGGFQARQNGGVHEAIGQRFPGFNLRTLAPLAGNKLANR